MIFDVTDNLSTCNPASVFGIGRYELLSGIDYFALNKRFPGVTIYITDHVILELDHLLVSLILNIILFHFRKQILEFSDSYL